MNAFHLVSEDALQDLAKTYGVWAVFVSVTVESTGIPVPSETILIAVAIAAAGGDGHTAIALVVLAAAAGAILGDNLGYVIGRTVGASVLRRVGLSSSRQRLGRYLFQRYGGWIVVVARFVSVLRTCVSLLAGTTQMPWPKFLAYNALGGCLWAAVIGFGAYALGQQARTWSWAASLVVGGLAVLALIVATVIVKRQKDALQAEADKAFPETA